MAKTGPFQAKIFNSMAIHIQINFNSSTCAQTQHLKEKWALILEE